MNKSIIEHKYLLHKGFEIISDNEVRTKFLFGVWDLNDGYVTNTIIFKKTNNTYLYNDGVYSMGFELIIERFHYSYLIGTKLYKKLGTIEEFKLFEKLYERSKTIKRVLNED